MRLPALESALFHFQASEPWFLESAVGLGFWSMADETTQNVSFSTDRWDILSTFIGRRPKPQSYGAFQKPRFRCLEVQKVRFLGRAVSFSTVR